MAGFSDILDSYIAGQSQALNTQLGVARLNAQREQNRVANQLAREQFEYGKQQDFLTNRENQKRTSFLEAANTREQDKADRTTRNDRDTRIVSELEQRFDLTQPLTLDMALDPKNEFYMSRLSELSGVREAIGGAITDFELIPGTEETGTPIYTIRVQNDRTGTEGPVTSRRGTDGDEVVMRYTEEDINNLLNNARELALSRGGYMGAPLASRLSDVSTRGAEAEAATAEPIKPVEQYSSVDADALSEAQPAAQNTADTEYFRIPGSSPNAPVFDEPVEAATTTSNIDQTPPTGVAGGRGNVVENQGDRALSNIDQQLPVAQRRARWEELSMRRRGFLSPQEIDELDQLQQEFGGFQRPARGGATDGTENRQALAQLTAQRDAVMASRPAADPANQTALYNPQALGSQAQPSPSSQALTSAAAGAMPGTEQTTPASLGVTQPTQANIPLGYGTEERVARTVERLAAPFINTQNSALNAYNAASSFTGSQATPEDIQAISRLRAGGYITDAQASNLLGEGSFDGRRTDRVTNRMSESRQIANNAGDNARTVITNTQDVNRDIVKEAVSQAGQTDREVIKQQSKLTGESQAAAESAYKFVVDELIPNSVTLASDNEEIQQDYARYAVSVWSSLPRGLRSNDPGDNQLLVNATVNALRGLTAYNNGEPIDASGFLGWLDDNFAFNTVRDIARGADIDKKSLNGMTVIALGMSGLDPRQFADTVISPLAAMNNGNVRGDHLSLVSRAIIGYTKRNGVAPPPQEINKIIASINGGR